VRIEENGLEMSLESGRDVTEPGLEATDPGLIHEDVCKVKKNIS